MPHQEIQKTDRRAGDQLRNIRHANGLTQNQLGNFLGVTYQQIQKYENGTNRMSVGLVGWLCRYLDISPLLFFEEAREINEWELAWLSLGRGLSDRNREIIVKMINLLAESDPDGPQPPLRRWR